MNLIKVFDGFSCRMNDLWIFFHFSKRKSVPPGGLKYNYWLLSTNSRCRNGGFVFFPRIILIRVIVVFVCCRSLWFSSGAFCCCFSDFRARFSWAYGGRYCKRGGWGDFRSSNACAFRRRIIAEQASAHAAFVAQTETNADSPIGAIGWFSAQVVTRDPVEQWQQTSSAFFRHTENCKNCYKYNFITFLFHKNIFLGRTCHSLNVFVTENGAICSMQSKFY